MRVAIVHYHLQQGGVTRVIEHAVRALEGGEEDVLLISGQAPEAPMPAPVLVVPELAYDTRKPADPARLLEGLERAAETHWNGLPDLWHVHNPSLGKNSALPEVLWRLLEKGQRLLLQPHDFAEDGRADNYRRLRRAHARLAPATPWNEWIYPAIQGVAYALINPRDAAFLQAAGLPETRCHLLPNPVHVASEWPVDNPVDETVDKGRLWLYPTRAIRRKNLGELLLWAALGEPDDRFGVTLSPRNPKERPGYEAWKALAAELGLPVEFELGEGADFTRLVRQACALVTTSITEGFGLAYLESWLLDRPLVGRDLPEITAQFKMEGMRLDHLYERCEVPLDWIDRPALERAIRGALQRTAAAYGIDYGPEAVARVRAAWIRNGRIDFGRLDESFQSTILRRVAGSRTARTEITPPFPALPESEVLDTNRRIVHEAHDLPSYSERLRAIYRQLLEDAAPPASIDADRLLTEFLAPERLWLLRT